jgi:hypothetical protein
MAGLNRSVRGRPCDGLWAAGILLAVAGLTASGLEDAFSGHVHLMDGSAVHHYHFYLGEHEHHETDPAHDPDDDHDHHPEAPAPHHHAPLRTATVSAAPALFQPVSCRVLPAPVAPSALVTAPIALRGTARPVGPPARPRAPPAAVASPDFLT